MRLVPARAALLGGLFATLVTIPGLGSGSLWDNSETAYGEVAREIVLGGDWIVMHLNGAAWFVQPPLYFWIAALFAQVAGLSELAMRLPSALATIAMSAALGYATARSAGTRAGAIAAIVLATSLMQAIVGRLAIMDALLNLCITAAILWWFRALEPHEPFGPEPGKRATAFLLGAVALALGTLAKGPVAPVIVVLVIAAWAGWELRRGARVLAPARWTLAAAALLYAAVVVPWFVAVTARVGPHAAVELIGHYTIGRYTGVIENQSGPWWYYLPVLILGFFPWIAFAPVAFVRAAAAAREHDHVHSLLRLALCWSLVPFVFFSFAQTKLPSYIAMILPALAILVALWFERFAAGGDRRAGIASAATIPFFVATVALAIALFSQQNTLNIRPLLPELLALGVVILLGSLLTLAVAAIPRAAAGTPYVLAATSALLVLWIALVAEPIAERLKPVPQLAAIVERERGPDSVVAIRDVSGGNALVFYTRPGVRTILPDASSYLALICSSADVFVLVRARDADGLATLAGVRGRHASERGRVTSTALLRIDGPGCATK